MRKILLVFAGFFALQCLTAQTNKYWVFFTDKQGVEFNPHDFFDQKAIERREKLGLDLYDQTDFPVNTSYLSQVESIVTKMSHHSRWFNAVAVVATKEEIDHAVGLAFVKKATPFPQTKMQITDGIPAFIEVDSYLELLSTAQTVRLGRRKFQESGIDGKGIRIAVLDAGFTDADINKSFDHLRAGNRILHTHDFVKNKENVYLGNMHGTAVLSCIAGIFKHDDGKTDTLGLATGAEFLLARTEKGMIEVFSEEENWLAAVEWADKHGADIINSSLGYGGDRYTYQDMDGQATLCSRAGNLAAKKGILVVNSAGNEGSDDWNFIGSPADADSVLTIGGISPSSGIQIPFSSVGPTYDYRMKPNVTAYGDVTAASGAYLTNIQGTSFSSPLTAGFAACAWQTNPDWSNMELFRKLETNSDLFPYFDYAHGFGVPLADKFLNKEEYPSEPTMEVVYESQVVQIKILYPSVDEQIQESSFSLDYEDFLFYHFENQQGHLVSYHVIDLEGTDNFSITIPYGTTVFRCHYEGFTKEIKL